MHIVHVLTRLLKAGSEENTFVSAIGQVSAGHRVSVLYGADADKGQVAAWSHHFDMVQIASLVHPLNPVKDLQAVLEMRAALRRLAPDIVHTHQSKAGVVGRIAARGAKVPVVVHGVHIIPFEQTDFLRRSFYLAAERFCALFTDVFVHVSNRSRETYLKNNIGSAIPHVVVRSGMDMARFRDASWPEDWSALTGVSIQSDKPPVIALVAALEERKQHVQFIECLSRISDRPPNLVLLCAGEGPMESEIRMAAARHGMADQVKLLGYRTDPERIIALADISVSVSEREGLPRTVVQSLAAGKPTFVMQTLGMDDEILQHPLCFAFQQGELQKLTSSAMGRLRDGASASKGAAAELGVLAEWDAPAMAEKLQQAYNHGVKTR